MQPRPKINVCREIALFPLVCPALPFTIQNVSCFVISLCKYESAFLRGMNRYFACKCVCVSRLEGFMKIGLCEGGFARAFAGECV